MKQPTEPKKSTTTKKTATPRPVTEPRKKQVTISTKPAKKKQPTQNEILEMMNNLNVNLDVVTLETMMEGIKVEMEHGLVDSRTNISNDDLLTTMKIALAHLVEYPDYYRRLKTMESQAEKYWSTRTKPEIFLPKKR